MPRLPAYRHYRPKNLAVVRLNGRDVNLGKSDSPASREKYRRVVAEWLARPCQPGPKASPDPDPVRTVSGSLVAFWDHATDHYRTHEGSPSEELGNIKVALRPLRALRSSTTAPSSRPGAAR